MWIENDSSVPIGCPWFTDTSTARGKRGKDDIEFSRASRTRAVPSERHGCVQITCRCRMRLDQSVGELEPTFHTRPYAYDTGNPGLSWFAELTDRLGGANTIADAEFASETTMLTREVVQSDFRVSPSRAMLMQQPSMHWSANTIDLWLRPTHSISMVSCPD